MASDRLIDKHRPRTLAEVVGQPFVCNAMAEFAANPYPCALIFAGYTGSGKTTMARALARELNVYEAADLIEVRSGELDGEMLEWLSAQLRFPPMRPGGWRVIIADEADLMTPKAERLFLSVLDDLPSRTVIVFTTNRPEWFEARERLLHRCELFPFASDAATLYLDAERLVARVWQAETGRTDAPDLATLGIPPSGNLSFRDVVQAVQGKLRPERFALSSPKQAPASLLSLCGPFGRKADPEPVPFDEPAWVDPLPDDDDEPESMQPSNVYCTDVPVRCRGTREGAAAGPGTRAGDAGRPGAARARASASSRDMLGAGDRDRDVRAIGTPTIGTSGPDSARGFVATLAERPSVHSISKRFGISWDTARRILDDRFPRVSPPAREGSGITRPPVPLPACVRSVPTPFGPILVSARLFA